MALLDDDATWWVSGDPKRVAHRRHVDHINVRGLTAIIEDAMPDTLSMRVTADVDRVAVEANPRGYVSRSIFFELPLFVVDQAEKPRRRP